VSVLSLQPSPLRDQVALNFVVADVMTHIRGMATSFCSKPAIVEGARHLLRKRGAHADNIEGSFTEAFHSSPENKLVIAPIPAALSIGASSARKAS